METLYTLLKWLLVYIAYSYGFHYNQIKCSVVWILYTTTWNRLISNIFFFNFCFRNKTQSSTADPKLIQSECREGTRTWFGFALIMLQCSLLTRIVHSECVWITKYLIKYKKLIKRYSQNSMCTVYQTMLFLLLFRLNGLIKTCPFNNYNLWLHCCIISAKQNYNLKSWSKWHEWVIKLKYSCVKNVLLNIDI